MKGLQTDAGHQSTTLSLHLGKICGLIVEIPIDGLDMTRP